MKTIEDLRINYENMINMEISPEIEDEIETIAFSLCGAGNWRIAVDFMLGGTSEEFLQNVSFNSADSAELIHRAIVIRRMNK